MLRKSLKKGESMLVLQSYSFGIGDRFAHQAKAQLSAFVMLRDQMNPRPGLEVVPVWNKSNREHTFIGSEPQSVYDSGVAAVAALDWKLPWYVDADHIQRSTVDRFVACSNFFTIDVADSIGKSASDAEVADFVRRHPEFQQPIAIPGIQDRLEITQSEVERVARKYLLATRQAGEIYRYIESKKGVGRFVPEVSMDETDSPQTPPELLIILAALADEGCPVQTIAPKFTGRFNKGVDYVGDLVQFEKEFFDDLAVIQFAIGQYGLPNNLKLSVHSGSDKFGLYPIIRKAIHATGAGIHLKTAGTTWLEEIIGLAEAGGDGLALAKEIYAYAFEHIDELCMPYASVIDIDRTRLPSSSEVARWDGPKLASTIRHVPNDPSFNANVRQLLHVSFKVAAKAGSRFTDLLKANETIVGAQVTTNLFDRHLKPLFLG